MVTLGVGPLMVVGIRTINVNKEALQTSILNLHTEIAISLSEKIAIYLTEIGNEIPYITKIVTAPDIPWEARETVLRTMVDSHPNIVSVSLLDKEGNEKTKVFNPSLEKRQKLFSFRNDATFKKLSALKKTFEASSVYYLDENKGEEFPRINLFYSLPNNISALVVLNLKPIWNEISAKRFGKSGHALIFDRTGRIINPAPGGKGSNLSGSGIVERAVKSLTVGSAEYRDASGVEMIGSYAPVKVLEWSVIVQEPKKEAYFYSILMQRQAAAVIILSAFLSGIIAFFLARQLTSPILDLIKAAAGIARRDFSVKVNSRTNDELNDLILTFNEMGGELKKYDDMQIDKLIAEKTKTEAVIFSIADGIIMTDITGRVLLINRQARSILGMENMPAEERYFWDYIGDDRLLGAFKSLISESGGGGGETKFREIDLSTPSTSRYYNAGTKPVVTQKGDKIGLVTVIRDITLEKEIDRMKDDFMHSITHDLRNPMTSIRGFLKFLIDGTAGTLNEQQKKMVATMDVASSRLLGMINDILDLAKLESGRMELHLGETDIKEVAKQVLELMEPQLAKKSISAGITFPDGGADTLIHVDQHLIERVIINLVGNSVKFTPECGKINLGIRDADGGIEVTVADNGEGVPPEYLDKIFDKFQQVAGQRKGGTGLGLTICKYIVESHCGRIWVKSRINEGTTFGFFIPKGLSLSSKGEIICGA